MSLNLISLAATPPTPWRNGGGTTRELLAWPAAEAWALRLSVATIASSGPFSAWPGVARHFVVLSGAGVDLRWPGHRVILVPGDEPLSFDGAEAPDCRLLDGTTEDLNLMIARGRGGLQVARPGQDWQPAAAWRGCFTLDAATLDIDGRPQALPAGTLAWSTEPGCWTLQAEGSSRSPRAWWLHLEHSAP